MTYSFQPYLERISVNWYQDDPLLEQLLSHYGVALSPGAEQALVEWGADVAGPLRALAEESARPENLPRLRHFDPYNRRVDEVVLPASTLEALGAVHGSAKLGALRGDPFLFYARGYLYAQNGEAGVACSMACTDGLVRALEALGQQRVHREVVEKIRASTPLRFYHGAQFVTEIQGGSDVAANAVAAMPDGDLVRLNGRKWFCSNINADYFLVTARPSGSPADGVGVRIYLVPAYLEEGDRRRNGYTIDRLKDKLGTRELATAEVTFDGAVAHPLGDPERGIADLITYVLVPSRFACVSFCASALRQAERIVSAYAEFRAVFGKRLLDYPQVTKTLAEIRSARERSLATTFELLRLWNGSGAGQEIGADPPVFRVMLSLCKTVLTRESTALLHEAMMLLGGNGIEERFSPLPRLYRDSVIMEIWEGSRNVLLAQALRDLARFAIGPAELVERIAGERRPELSRELGAILSSSSDPAAIISFNRLAGPLVHAFGDRALGPLR